VEISLIISEDFPAILEGFFGREIGGFSIFVYSEAMRILG
jgi:hypothetical protein